MALGDKSKKERAADKAAQAEAAAAKAAEDASWQNDKSTKETRAAAKVKEMDEKNKAKAELRALTAADEQQLAKLSNKKGPSKTTQAQINKNAALMGAIMMMEGPKKPAKKSTKSDVVKQPDLVPNQNHLRRELSMREGKELVEGGIDVALEALDGGDGGAGTKNRKVAYNAFVDRMMPIIQDENPNLKRSQYTEKIAKLWQKSPENPANQQ